MSSKYEEQSDRLYSTLFISWNIAGAFHKPNGMTLYKYKPLGVIGVISFALRVSDTYQ